MATPLPATLVGVNGKVLRAQFDALTLQEEEALTMGLYSRADTWLGWGKSREFDCPLRIFQISMHGFARTAHLFARPTRAPRPKGRLGTASSPSSSF